MRTRIPIRRDPRPLTGARLPRLPLVLAAVALATAALSARQAPAPLTPEAERERWNKVFAMAPPNIRTDANQFLVQVVSNLKPGQAIDVGMGFGRNALYLAKAGWIVTGIDISDVGVEKARQQAEMQKLPLTTIRADALTFDYGRERWDLIAVMYMGPIAITLADRLTDALTPGGLLVIEHFLREKPEDKLGYSPGVLPKAFPRLEVLRHAEEDAAPDYAQHMKGRVVRFLARKKP